MFIRFPIHQIDTPVFSCFSQIRLILAVALVFVPALALLHYLGRFPSLISVGAVLPMITLVIVMNEKRAAV